MMKNFQIFATLLIVGMFSFSPALVAQEKKMIPLFNGQNLDGWYTFLKSKGKNSDPDKVFSVTDGVIRVSGT
ncbi:MAG: DUF1080 domain-containing protein, partial [Planctomycetaceae bacterium]|nr:DUF1080 domain-containing protein [Planctomycetaceae bacterium]